jgi:hypothetical protein
MGKWCTVTITDGEGKRYLLAPVRECARLAGLAMRHARLLNGSRHTSARARVSASKLDLVRARF